MMLPEHTSSPNSCFKHSDACQEKYAWGSALLYVCAVGSFAIHIHDTYATVGWSAATLITFAYAVALRHKRINNQHIAPAIRQAAPVLWVIASGLLAYCAWCIYDGLRLGQTLAPPYNGNRYLGSISAFVAMSWAVRFARWARETPAENHNYAGDGGGDKTEALLNDYFA